MALTQPPSAAMQRVSHLALLASIVESVDDAIISETGDHVITTWNPGAERMFGYSTEEAVGRSLRMLTPSDEADKAAAAFERISAGEAVVHYETVRVRRDGSHLPVSVTLSPVRDDGCIVGVSSIERDITERLEVEHRVRSASEYARSLIEASLDPLVAINPDGHITDLNQATETVTGRSREALIGTDFSDYFTDPEKARESYERVFAGETVTDYSLTFRRRDGHLIEVLYNASLYKDPNGNVLGVVAAARDITLQRRAENAVAVERKRERDRLAELERFKQLTVGRELKMIELKEEIAELNARIQATEHGS